MKISNVEFTAEFKSRTQQLIYNDGYYIFGVYLGKWRRIRTEFKKLQFIRNLLLYLNNDEDTFELSGAFNAAEKVVKAFNLLENEFKNK